jgi:serine protease Do
VREDGYIATSAFNVSGTIKSISVQTHDGKRYKARILRRDRELDLALLKIDAKGLPVLKEGKPRKLRQGSFVAVIGRSPDPFRPTIVWGIVSARNRFRATTFQTDAKMNFGNVGGPVVDLDGKLLGIASHVKAQNRVRGRIAWVQSCGIGFATKIKFIRRWLRRYKKEEPEKPPKPPREY